MQIEIQATRVPLSRTLLDQVKRRIELALTRFDQRIMKVSLWLSDVNGAKGGSDKKCHLQIIMTGKPDVVIEVTREKPHIAINLAIARAGKAVVRKLGRQRTRLRRSAQMPPLLPQTL
ncbi:MAG: putative sigma-54 modulation protein [Flavobacterium sp.]|jgi:putative sigma-54 modulation protein